MPDKPHVLDCPEGQGFLAAIREHPEDDTTRLVLADWLDEHDAPDRAEFIRLQVACARQAGAFGDPEPESPREQVLLQTYGRQWRALLPLRVRVAFQRGFPTSLTVVLNGGPLNWELFERCPTLCGLEVCLQGNVTWLEELLSGGVSPRLRWLALRGRWERWGTGATGFLDRACMRLLACRTDLGCLTGLDLANNPSINTEAATALASSPPLRRLERLNLSASTIGVGGLQAILRGFPALRRLDLTGDDLSVSRYPAEDAWPALPFQCRPTIGDEGACWLAKAPEADRLRWLNVAYNRLTVDGARALADSPYLRGLNRLVACEFDGLGRERTEVRKILEQGFGERLRWAPAFLAT